MSTAPRRIVTPERHEEDADASLRPQRRAIESEVLIGKSHPQSTRVHPIERSAAEFDAARRGINPIGAYANQIRPAAKQCKRGPLSFFGRINIGGRPGDDRVASL